MQGGQRPSWSHLGGRGRIGGRLRLGLGPIGVNWTLVHEASEDESGFVDVQRAGPFRSWRHSHRFLPTADGHTMLEDLITYRLPRVLPVTTVADHLFRRKLDQLFRFRHQRTRSDLLRHAEADAERLIDLGIDGVITNDVPTILALRERMCEDSACPLR